MPTAQFSEASADFFYQVGCDFTLPQVNITIIATDKATSALAGATVNVYDCGWQ